MSTAFRSLAFAGVVAALAVPAALPAQGRLQHPPQGGPGFLFHAPRVTLGVRGGFNVRAAGSGIYDFVTSELTLKKSDFNAFSIAGDFGVTIAGPLELVLGGGYTRTSTASESRDYVDQNDLPITQTTTLTTTPLTLAARYYLTPRGRQVGRFVWIPARFMPYVGVGGGMIRYSLEQVGSFVDVADLSIFNDTFKSWGWTPLGMVMAGADYSLGSRVFVNGDVRYLWANGELGPDFLGFPDGIDLSGVQFSLGLHVRI